MTRNQQVALIAVAVAIALPASAHAARVTGVVIAKDQKRGSFVLAGRSGVGTTVRAPRAHPRLGDRLLVNGPRLANGAVRGASLRVVGHARRATVRGIVVRQLSRQTLVSTGGSVISIRHSFSARSLSMAGGHSDFKTGAVARFGLAISTNGVSQTAVTRLGTSPNARIEGQLVTVSPLVVSVKGLPITINVPPGVTLPIGLTPGDHVELTVSVGDGNSFALVSSDDQVGNQAGDDHQNAVGNNHGAGDDNQADANDDQGDDDNQDDNQGDDRGASSGSGSSGSGPSGGDHGNSASGFGSGDDGGGSGGFDD